MWYWVLGVGGGEWSSGPLGGRLHSGSLGSQLPCLLLHPLPILLGPKESGGGAASYKSGSPTTSSLSRALFPSPDARDHVAPRATRSQVPRAQRKKLPRPNHPAPRSPKAPAAASGTRPAAAGVSQPPAGSHQKNRREQKFASCSGLGFRILPAGAAAGRGRAALVMELLLEAPAGRLEAQTQRGPLRETEPPALGVEHRGAARSAPLPLGLESGALGAGPLGGQAGSAVGRAGVRRDCRREARLQADLMEPVRATAAPKPLGCKFYQRARSEPGSPPRRRRGRGRAASETLPQLW